MGARLVRAVDGAAMSTGLDRIEVSRLASIGNGFSHWPEKAAARYLKRGFILLPAVLIAGLGVWILLPGYTGEPAKGEPVNLATAVTGPAQPPVTDAAVTNTVEKENTFDPATAEAIVPEQPTPVDRLKISSQSWRRGGLGSKALVTFTLRNNNDYAVKDIEIACAFARQDGTHLTDRRRVISDTVNMRSRKTFARLHVGFVNINANKAKCSLVAATRI
jgi:hypothetical protein